MYLDIVVRYYYASQLDGQCSISLSSQPTDKKDGSLSTASLLGVQALKVASSFVVFLGISDFGHSP